MQMLFSTCGLRFVDTLFSYPVVFVFQFLRRLGQSLPAGRWDQSRSRWASSDVARWQSNKHKQRRQGANQWASRRQIHRRSRCRGRSSRPEWWPQERERSHGDGQARDASVWSELGSPQASHNRSRGRIPQEEEGRGLLFSHVRVGPPFSRHGWWVGLRMSCVCCHSARKETTKVIQLKK